MRWKVAFVLVALGPPLPAEGQAREGGAWHLIAPRSVVADEPSITLELDALNMVRGAVVAFRPALYLRCVNEQLEAFVAIGAVPDRDADYRTRVRLRWADRPPLEEAWRRSTDYAAVFAPDPAAFIQQLLATPAVVFEFRPNDADPIVAQFNGAGLDAHLPTLQSKCSGAAVDDVYGETEVDDRAELLSMPDAEYPRLLRRVGIGGTVIVQAVIDTLGRVVPRTLRVLSSPNAAFNAPARDAVEQAVFRPARVRGRRVRVRLQLAIEFPRTR